MRRWAINLLCLFSLLIFTASVAIWVRSYSSGDLFEWSSAKIFPASGRLKERAWTLGTARGAVRFTRASDEYPPGGFDDLVAGWTHHAIGPEDWLVDPGPWGNGLNADFLGIHLRT